MSKQTKRDVNGILILDKPFGFSSNKALQKVKYLFRAKKAGHTGNLDPLATGVLPICLGHATKISQYLLDAEKTYLAGIHLGISTTTGDKEGDIIVQKNIDAAITENQIKEAIDSFLGVQEQVPPMHSAIKYKGKPLYKLAREGIQVERKPRTITIYSINIVQINLPELLIEVSCSKGTYIRSLAESIGEKLDCGAHLSSLRRIRAGCFDIKESITLDEMNQDFVVNDSLLKPMDRVLQHYPSIHLTEPQTEDVLFGRKIKLEQLQVNFLEIVESEPDTSVCVRLYKPDHSFIGLAEFDNKFLYPKRLFID